MTQNVLRSLSRKKCEPSDAVLKSTKKSCNDI